MLTEDQLKSMELAAPLLVDEYRKMDARRLDAFNEIERLSRLVITERELANRHLLSVQAQLDVWNKSDHGALARLATRLIYTIRSGIIAASNVEEMTTDARRLGVYK